MKRFLRRISPMVGNSEAMLVNWHNLAVTLIDLKKANRRRKLV